MLSMEICMMIMVIPWFYQYMNMLFPTSHSKMCMLDEKFDVDIQTAEKREFLLKACQCPSPRGSDAALRTTI